MRTDLAAATAAAVAVVGVPAEEEAATEAESGLDKHELVLGGGTGFGLGCLGGSTGGRMEPFLEETIIESDAPAGSMHDVE